MIAPDSDATVFTGSMTSATGKVDGQVEKPSTALRQLPQSADLRGRKFVIRYWDHFGPSSLKAIAATIQDVRRQSASKSYIDPSPLFIQYGDLVIAGFAPQLAKARWPCGANAERESAAGLRDGSAAQARGVGSSALRGAAGIIKAASPIAANDGPSAGAIDLGLQVGPVTLYQLKASLAEGQPFSFLFLPYVDAATKLQPTSGSETIAGGDEFAEVYAATAVGYDDQQEAFLVVKQSADAFHKDCEIMMLSYAYWTHSVLSQDVWTIWRSKPPV